ncbi:hypothetical protein [uncultured Clostridium sp.]|uniref:hypothetical protein n=1 Tax=uncultured Clostridium sp. TaxID=59620 RepID=UPI0026122F88|nr:hypothetical protein [uncultured Clostridium sp.]
MKKLMMAVSIVLLSSIIGIEGYLFTQGFNKNVHNTPTQVSVSSSNIHNTSK